MKKIDNWNRTLRIFLISMLGLLGWNSVHAVTTTYEKNELKIVITPDYFPIIWMNAEKYGVDFSYDGSHGKRTKKKGTDLFSKADH